MISKVEDSQNSEFGQYIAAKSLSKKVLPVDVFVLSSFTKSFLCRIFFCSKTMLVTRGGDSHMKQTGMLVGNFEFNP